MGKDFNKENVLSFIGSQLNMADFRCDAEYASETYLILNYIYNEIE